VGPFLDLEDQGPIVASSEPGGRRRRWSVRLLLRRPTEVYWSNQSSHQLRSQHRMRQTSQRGIRSDRSPAAAQRRVLPGASYRGCGRIREKHLLCKTAG